jgi:hypothetical protein
VNENFDFHTRGSNECDFLNCIISVRDGHFYTGRWRQKTRYASARPVIFYMINDIILTTPSFASREPCRQNTLYTWLPWKTRNPIGQGTLTDVDTVEP